MNLELKHFLINRDKKTVEKKTNASEEARKNKIMHGFETDNQMEILLKAKQNQPELYAKLPAATKMSLGIYESTKTTTNGLSADDRLKLAGLKQSIAQDVLSPQERITKSVEILNLEEKNKKNDNERK